MSSSSYQPAVRSPLSLDSVLDLLLYLFDLGIELLRKSLVLHRPLVSQDSSTLNHTDQTKEEVDSGEPVVTVSLVDVQSYPTPSSPSLLKHTHK